MSSKVELVKFRPNEQEINNRRGKWNTAMTLFREVNMSDLSDTIYVRAGNIAVETGRPVRVQGGKITISETQRGTLMKKRTRQIDIEFPNLEIL